MASSRSHDLLFADVVADTGQFRVVETVGALFLSIQTPCCRSRDFDVDCCYGHGHWRIDGQK